jgi:PAS domain S-box-containing protein
MGRVPATEELRALLDALPASVALWDRDVRLRYGNRRALTRFGRPAETLLGVHLSEVVQAHAVELSRQYIDGALAGVPQQVERAMVDPDGQRYNAHQVTHIPNVVDGVVQGYCAFYVDITASIEAYEHARRAREEAASRAVRERFAGGSTRRVVNDLSDALERLDAAVIRASDALPSLDTAADAIDRAIDELRAMVPAGLLGDRVPTDVLASFPAMSSGFDVDPLAPPGQRRGVSWPADVTGGGWAAEDLRGVLDLVPAAISAWDGSLRPVYANRHAHGLLGAEFLELNRTHAQAALLGEMRQVNRTVAHATGLRHVQAFYFPRARGGQVDGVYSLVVDVTARVEAELALQDARAELASARERERIADNLHNLVIQQLFAAGLAASIPSATLSDAQLHSVQDGILKALTDLEAAMTALHENVGLLDLLPDLARVVHDATSAHGIVAAIENVGSVEYVPPAVGAELLAVAEAALSDIVAQSRASEVVVTIAADAALAWLRVADDAGGVMDFRVPVAPPADS